MTTVRDTLLVVRPNASMSVRAAQGVMLVMATVCLSIAGLFTWHGFWPVLPFAGLELAALAWALQVSLRRNRYREVIEFDDQRLRVECGMSGEGAALLVDWARSMTRVQLEMGPHRNDPSRLKLVNGSQSLELGRCLTDGERERLATRLRELILAGWRAGSPVATKGAAPDCN
ncbi:DUF2244 domain-containing protein [Nevskia sp.]|uniref:DUF2244 domain-containing protein n=1 Tax=Nevskia sp. TaxID=1929292 RepID=UPI0025CC6817|nr:DUF2244 domain-containing protein [Nevskia sp.]